jgi:hypothetical protein
LKPATLINSPTAQPHRVGAVSDTTRTRTEKQRGDAGLDRPF